MSISKSTLFYLITGICFLTIGFTFRSSGLFHGLEDGIVFHPDTSKQIKTLEEYLGGNYVTYYNSLFYDGYPYGLNRIDEILIRGVYGVFRPLHGLFNGGGENLAFPDREALYYWTRVFRLLYGMVGLVLISLLTLLLSLKFRKGIRPEDSNRANATTAFCMAISSFPLVAVLLSTAFKPVAQPFHFSYVIPALAVSAGLLTAYMSQQKSRLKMCGLWILLLSSVAPWVRQSLSENFHWRRGALDASVNAYILETMRRPLYRPPDFQSTGAIKQFGSEGSPAEIPSFSIEEEQQLSEIRFLETDTAPEALPRSPWMKPENIWLPAGRYQLRATLHNPGREKRKLRISLEDPSEFFPIIQSDFLELNAGYTDVDWVFEKGFAPHEVTLGFDLQGQGAVVMDWEIRPLIGRGPETVILRESTEGNPLELGFPDGLQICALKFISHPDDPGGLQYAIRATLTKPVSQQIFEEMVIFLHLEDQNGKTLETLDIPLNEASFKEDSLVFHKEIVAAEIREKVSSLRLGLYSARTHPRLRPTLPKGAPEGLILEKDSLSIQAPYPLLDFFHSPPQ